MDYIFIYGAPGSGKSSLAWALQAKLESPCFEFGWIPEFRIKRNSTISYEEEENLAFENLTLVIKNYVQHGFSNILVTDLRDHIVKQLPTHFSYHQYVLVTLYLDDEQALKARVLDESRSSSYRDWQEAVALNTEIINRPLMKHEVRLASDQTIEELTAKVIALVSN